MTARCVEMVDAAGKRWHTMVVDTPLAPKPSWLGRAVVHLTIPQLLGVGVFIAFATWALTRMFTAKERPVRPETECSVSLMPNTGITGKWIGRDAARRFENLFTSDNTRIVPNSDDFYLAFRCGDPYTPFYLPSTLFKNAKEGDLVGFILNNRQYEFRLEKRSPNEDNFEVHFEAYKREAVFKAPGLGAAHTYGFAEDRPENSQYIGNITLSAAAHAWNSETNKMEPVKDSDCRAMEGSATWAKFGVNRDLETFADPDIRLVAPSETGELSLIADRRVIFIAGTFQGEKCHDILKLPYPIDATSVKVARAGKIITISVRHVL